MLKKTLKVKEWYKVEIIWETIITSNKRGKGAERNCNKKRIFVFGRNCLLTHNVKRWHRLFIVFKQVQFSGNAVRYALDGRIIIDCDAAAHFGHARSSIIIIGYSGHSWATEHAEGNRGLEKRLQTAPPPLPSNIVSRYTCIDNEPLINKRAC